MNIIEINIQYQRDLQELDGVASSSTSIYGVESRSMGK